MKRDELIRLYDHDRVFIRETCVRSIATLIELGLVYEMRRRRGWRRFHCLEPYEDVLRKADAAVTHQENYSHQCTSQQDVTLERLSGGQRSKAAYWNRRVGKRRIESHWSVRRPRIAA